MIYLVWRVLEEDDGISKALVGAADTWGQAAKIAEELEASDNNGDFYYSITPVVKNTIIKRGW